MEEPPTELDGWKLGECLGKGACGRVYEVTRKDGLRAAMKLARFRAVKKKTEIDYTNFIAKESMLLTSVKARGIPYLPYIYQKSTTLRADPTKDGWTFMVMEKFEKGSLRDYARNNKIPLAAPFVFGIGWRLVKCMQVLHGSGWLHLDIKPGNVMVADDPKRGIAVIDFGLSKPIAYTKRFPRKHFDGSYDFLGWHVWDVAPESPRDDLEAVGLVMAWLLRGGNLPWSNDETEDMKRQIQDPRMPHNATTDPVLRRYLLKVRGLGVHENPDYDGLLTILASRAEDHVEYLELPGVLNGCHADDNSPVESQIR